MTIKALDFFKKYFYMGARSKVARKGTYDRHRGWQYNSTVILQAEIGFRKVKNLMSKRIYGYKKTNKKYKDINVCITNESLAERFDLYCREHNLNKTKLIEAMIIDFLDEHYEEWLREQSKEDLVQMLLAK